VDIKSWAADVGSSVVGSDAPEPSAADEDVEMEDASAPAEPKPAADSAAPAPPAEAKESAPADGPADAGAKEGDVVAEGA